MSRIRIDLADLAMAMSDHENEWVLDMQTGHVLMADWIRAPWLHGLEDEDFDDEDEPEERELDPERYRFIDSIPSHDGFRWMEQFARSQEDDRVRERLLDVLDRPKPFRRFKDALPAFPEVGEAWFRYEDERLEEEARAWLEAEGIDAELVDARTEPEPSTQPGAAGR
jgi:hypothetical protein